MKPGERVERPNCGATTADGLACDREFGHLGDHRAYRAEQDVPVFWPQVVLDVRVTPALGSCLFCQPRVALGESLSVGADGYVWRQCPSCRRVYVVGAPTP